MSLGPSHTPARDGSGHLSAFEIEIEVVWGRLRWKAMTVCLSPQTGLLTTRWPRSQPYPGEVGTFTRAISLADFRAECFGALELARGARIVRARGRG